MVPTSVNLRVGGGTGDLQVLEKMGSYASDEGKVSVMSGVKKASLHAQVSQWKKSKNMRAEMRAAAAQQRGRQQYYYRP